MSTRTLKAAAVAALLLSAAAPTRAATFFFNNSPYLSSANVPIGFYDGNVPAFLDDLEDGNLGGLVSGSLGSVIGPGTFDTIRDSVDADDGSIDGNCTPQSSKCRSWFHNNGPQGVTFTYTGGTLPTAFALVWTDGSGSVTFSAIDGAGNSLGSITELGFADNNSASGTGEDRFFGVTHAGGIKSITISNGLSGGMELDHIQYGNMAAAIPEPASALLLLLGLGGVAAARQRAQRRA